jgi:hypothetical protein
MARVSSTKFLMYYYVNNNLTTFYGILLQTKFISIADVIKKYTLEFPMEISIRYVFNNNVTVVFLSTRNTLKKLKT